MAAAITTTPTGLAIVAPGTSAFPPTSRYYQTAVQQHTTRSSGRVVAYLDRRFLPSADRFTVLTQHTVTQGERLDNIAAQYLGDPTQFWRICDANNAMQPDDLTATLGRTLNITLPEGIAKAHRNA